MQDIIDYVSKTNWQTIIAMFAIGWYFTRDLHQDMRSIKDEMRSQGQRIDHLYQICIDLLKQK